MPGPVDNVLKYLTELSPQDWVARGGWPAAAATVIDADIATISGAADKVIRVEGAPDWLLSVDFQSGHDSPAKLPDLLLYNSALFKRHGLPVRTLLVVMHPRADSPQLTGLYERGFPGEPADVVFRYHVLRVWQVPPERWLAGGLGLVPLAPLADAPPEELPAVIEKMKRRLARETRRDRATAWSAAAILMGAFYEKTLIKQLLEGVANMEESVIYQEILQKGIAKGLREGRSEGRAEEARSILLIQGRRRFGEPSAEAVAAVNALTDVQKLEELSVRLLEATSWEELLGPNGRSRRRRGRQKAP